jgi:hypothetical protein
MQPKREFIMNKHLLAIAAASLCVSAWAADSTNTPPSRSQTTNPSARDMRDSDRERLAQQLQAAQSRADYAKVLEDNGYRISAINADKPDYLEYEVVKADRSYEVQLDFDKGSAKATKVDVTANLWRADSTKRMLQDPAYKPTAALTADPKSRYSDRRYIKAADDEKERLQKLMTPNQSVAAYKGMIEKMGYRITAVNDREPDYVEYEIVKGNNSYEVQIDLDPKTKLGKKIDVATNVWEAEGTERAKDSTQARRN